jgi:hypothetical protein
VWAVIVTNQGYPVQVTLVASQDELEVTIQRARGEWGLGHERQVHVMENPTLSGSGNVQLKAVTLFADSAESPKYFLSVIPRVKTAKNQGAARAWQFCPDCGCSWLHHLEGQASLEVEDWDPRPCTECGCEKAVTP